MDVTIELRMTKDLLTGMGARLRKELGTALDATAQSIERDAKASITDGPKTGIIYERGESEVSFTTGTGQEVSFTANRGKASNTHQASAPGEAPANDEGNLAGSIQWGRTGPLEREIAVGAEYGEVLELGSEDGLIEPRPYMAPAVEGNRERFEQLTAAAVRKAASG